MPGIGTLCPPAGHSTGRDPESMCEITSNSLRWKNPHEVKVQEYSQWRQNISSPAPKQIFNLYLQDSALTHLERPSLLGELAHVFYTQSVAPGWNLQNVSHAKGHNSIV